MIGISQCILLLEHLSQILSSHLFNPQNAGYLYRSLSKLSTCWVSINLPILLSIYRCIYTYISIDENLFVSLTRPALLSTYLSCARSSIFLMTVPFFPTMILCREAFDTIMPCCIHNSPRWWWQYEEDRQFLLGSGKKLRQDEEGGTGLQLVLITETGILISIRKRLLQLNLNL